MRTEPKTNGHSRQTVGIDELTGVWNRAGFVAAASPVFRSCQRREAPVALAYFDFYSSDTSISLTQDPTVDRILMAMGELMRKAFRASDVVGRIEALRFAVLLPDCTDEALAAVAGVRALTDGSTSSLSLAAGMVRNLVGGSFDDLMFAADMRTKQIKREQLQA
jgi:GGDEF domain-containing protein